MSINRLLFLLYIMGACVACTKEDVVQRPEGEITIVPVWESYTGDFLPDRIKYYFYNINDHSKYPVIVEDLTGKGVITQVLPVGAYQLVGYNMNASADLVFDDTKNLTVVAKFPSYPYSAAPLNLCIISSNDILIHNKDVKKQEIIPVVVNTKSLELIFRPGKNITINKISGTLDGAFATINLINGKAFEDGSDIFFDVADPDKKIKFRISDIYSPSIQNEVDSFGFPLYGESKLSLTVEVNEDGNTVIKTGEFNLNEIIEEIRNKKIPDDDIILYVNIDNYAHENFKEKVKLTVDGE